MIPTITRGATHCYSAPENWSSELGLGECGDLSVRCEFTGQQAAIQCISTWKPSVDELQRLREGGVIEIGLLIPNQPVMHASVVNPADSQVGGIDEHGPATP